MTVRKLSAIGLCVCVLTVFILSACENTAAVIEDTQTTQTPEIIVPVRENTITAGTPEAGRAYYNTADAESHNTRHGLKRLLLTTDLNPQLPFNVSCYITTDTVSALLPAGIDLSSVVIEFEHGGRELKAGGQILVSGQSVLDLSDITSITAVSKSGTDFPLTLNIETLNTGIESVALTVEGLREITSKTEYVPCALYTSAGGNKISGTVKGRGHSSWGFPKKSYTVKLDTKEGLLGLPASRNWVLISNYQDKTLLRNDFASKLSMAVGMEVTMKTRSVDLWLNGSYWGTYLLSEKIEPESGRVDIPKFNENLPPDEVGYLLEWDGHIQEIPDGQRRRWRTVEDVLYDPAQDSYFINTTGWLVIRKPSSSDIQPGHLRYLYDYITRIESALDNGDYTTAARFMDMESFVKWYLVCDIMKNMDTCFWSSCYMYIDADGILHMGPVWDFDMSLGNCNYGSCDTPDGEYLAGSWYYRHLFRMAEFRELAKQILAETYDNIVGMTDYANDTAAMLERSQKQNFSVWDILGKPVGANPPNIIEAATYREQLDIMLDFFNRRLRYVSDFINNPD
ncbi:MAG: CotH kinase family protein [Eubacteriales bacterium]|nr:CotH kinase family protein [Eubacteriales bacterium]